MWPTPAWVASILHARMPRHDAARQLVGRGVDDDDARGGDRLSLEMGEALLHVVGAPVRRDDDHGGEGSMHRISVSAERERGSLYRGILSG